MKVVAAPVRELPPTPAQVLAGEGYRLLRRIGEGGYGEVWMAKVPGGDLCALKIVVRGGDRTAYEREKAAVARVEELSKSCRFLIPIDRVEIHDRRKFLSYVMPLADDATGHPVTDRPKYVPRTVAEDLKRRGRLPVEQCVEICKRVLGALEALHAEFLIHRDIKPSNIVYINGAAVLADVGLVTHAKDDVSQVCSESNRPPEGVGDEKGDLYAAAILLYRMATGNAAGLFPRAPSACRSQEFRRLARVFTMAAEKNPADRYVNAKAMTLALDWVLEKPLAAACPDLPRRSRFSRLAMPLPAARPQEQRPDTPEMARFKARIRNVVEIIMHEAAEPSGAGHIDSPRAAVAAAAEAVSLEFERRIGRVLPLLASACLMAEATVSPDHKSRKSLIRKARKMLRGFCGNGLFDVLDATGQVLGWTEKMADEAAKSIMGVPVLSVLTGGISTTVLAGRMWIDSGTQQSKIEQALRLIVDAADTAANELWDKHADQLSL